MDTNLIIYLFGTIAVISIIFFVMSNKKRKLSKYEEVIKKYEDNKAYLEVLLNLTQEDKNKLDLLSSADGIENFIRIKLDSKTPVTHASENLQGSEKKAAPTIKSNHVAPAVVQVTAHPNNQKSIKSLTEMLNKEEVVFKQYFQNILFFSPMITFIIEELSPQIEILTAIGEKLNTAKDEKKVQKLITEYNNQMRAIILTDYKFNRHDNQTFFDDVAGEIALAINSELDDIVTSYPLLNERMNQLKKGEEDILRLKHILNSKATSTVNLIQSFLGQVKVCQSLLSKLDEMDEHENNNGGILDLATTAIIAYTNPVVGFARAFQQMGQAEKVEGAYNKLRQTYYKECDNLLSIYSQMCDATPRLSEEWNSFTPNVYINFSKTLKAFLEELSKSELDLSIYLNIRYEALSNINHEQIETIKAIVDVTHIEDEPTKKIVTSFFDEIQNKKEKAA